MTGGPRLLRNFLPLSLFFVIAAQAQQLNCVATAVPALIRSEGITERIGDIVLSCSGGQPGASVVAGLTLFSTSTVITNRVSSSGVVDVVVSLETAAGNQILNTTSTLASAASVNIAGISFITPSSGAVSIRISNVRVNAWQAAELPVRIQLATNGPTSIRVDANPLTAGVPARGLLASYSSTFICNGSLGPDTITFASLINKGTRFASIRVTEGATNASSFEKRQPNSDSGTRIAVRYSGFPSGARLFVPDAIAGTSATTSTAGGDLGYPANGGSYTPTTQGQLLLARVRNTDSFGAGGTLAYTPGSVGSPVVNFNGASEVTLAGGAGIAVFEVMDANNAARESAQFPTFLVYNAPNDGTTAQGRVDISFGPLSNDSVASTSAPVPRFQVVPPPSDCQSLGDCNSGLFPILSLTPEPLSISAFTNSAPQVRYVRINNQGGSLLNWTASINYQGSATGWLTLDPGFGLNNATLRIDFTPGRLTAGVYNATLLIDAGPIAGSRSLPIRLELTDFAPPPPPFPVITSVVNGASFAVGPVAAGSIATVFGTNFGNQPPAVTFDDVPATVLFANATQINIRVPFFGEKSTAQVIVIMPDGRKSPARTVEIAAASAPGIFTPGVLNQDNTVNTALNGAPVGTVIQVYCTGLLTANVTARLGVEMITAPRYAGPAPGLLGLQQVNLDVPTSITANSVDLFICSGNICSPSVKVYTKPVP